jgi:UDP-N-acetylglucosamine 2-epimerase (non-hydrolysing)/GDP/UDP-N,N'-diacetylbacillosamine 2-epimerase (hydrolysing)
VLAVTGTRAEYGAMRPVYAAAAASPDLELELIVTGMHLAPQFTSSLAEVEGDRYGPLHYVPTGDTALSGAAMARALGEAVTGMAGVIEQVRPQLVLLQGDRGEMLAAAIAAAHQNVAIVHMSGGDSTGSIDEPIRNAISSFAHVHLTTCPDSGARLVARGESALRIMEVGEPGLDVILGLEPVPPEELALDLDLDLSRPIVLGTQHPVTTEAGDAARQMTETLAALAALGMQTVFTYPNTDAGGAEMVRVLQSYAGRPFLRAVPHLGSRRYLSLMRIAAVMVGNSSSGILEASSFRLPVVNIGTRQHGRTRACNVIDVGCDRDAIVRAVRFALSDPGFRAGLAGCVNPYGDGHAAARTVDVLRRLRLTPALVAKWLPATGPLLDQGPLPKSPPAGAPT